MVNPTEVKKQVQETVIKAIKRDGSADRNPLVASISLETGFNNDTIDKIMENMYEAKLIDIKNNILTIPAGQEEQTQEAE